jgi:hypothetical protein
VLSVNFQIDEEKRSNKSMLQIHKDWRKIMRAAKIAEQRRDIDWLSKKHVHQVGLVFFLLNHLGLPPSLHSSVVFKFVTSL